MRNIAIILAGGSGKRLGGDVPKQFLELGGKMIIQYSIEVFQQHPAIDEILLVCHVDYINMLQNCVESCEYSKVTRVLSGGVERYHSSVNAINALDKQDDCNLLFHDAARPFVSHRVISDCIRGLEVYNAVGVGIVTTDTIWSVEENHIDDIPNRATMYRAQTPQGFKYSTIKEAYDKAMKSNAMQLTDDCGVVKHYLPQEKIALVEGEENNIKITRKEDLLAMEQFIKQQNNL